MDMWHRLAERKPAFWVNSIQIHLMTDALDHRTGHKYKMSKQWGNLEGWERLDIFENASLAEAEGQGAGT